MVKIPYGNGERARCKEHVYDMKATLATGKITINDVAPFWQHSSRYISVFDDPAHQ
jgi:hypothetical protein